MCCALVSYVLSNVYMLHREVNWFLYTGLFLYHVFNSHAAQSDSDTEHKVFSEMVFCEPQWFGDDTKKSALVAVFALISALIFGSPSYF